MNGRKEELVGMQPERLEDSKTYTPPVLTVLGKVSEVTIGNSPGRPTDGVLPAKHQHLDNPFNS